MAVDGYLNFDTKIDTTGFNKGTKSISSGIAGLKGSLLKLGAAVGVAFSVTKLVEFGKQAVETASDVQEVQNVVDTAFGSMTYKAEQFAATAIEKFGMSELSAKKTASTYMAMSKGIGMAESAASDMAIEVAGLTGDVASFYNISQDLASTKLKSIWTGETETLKDLGIVMTQTNLNAYAMSKGFGKTIDKMTQAEQVQLRYKYVTDQLSLAQGDFAKTSGSWANQTRILTERWKEFMRVIGDNLVKVLTPVLQMLNTILSRMISIAKAISSLFGNSAESQEQSSKATQKNADAMGELADQTEAAAKAADKSTASFDELNSLSTESADSGASSSTMLGETGTDDFVNNTSQMTDKIQTLTNKIKKAFNEIMNHPIVKWIRGTFADAINFMVERFNDFKKFIDDLKQPLSELAANLDSVIKKIWEFWEPIADTAWEEYKNITTAIDKAMQSVTASAINLANKFSELWQAIYGFLDSIGVIKMWQTQFSNIIRLASGVIQEFANWISEKVKGIEKTFGGLAEFLTGVFTGDWNKAFSGLRSIFSGFRIGIDADVGLFKGIFGKITGFLKDTWNNASAFLKTVLSKIGEFFNTLPQKLGYALGQASAKVLEWGVNMINWAKTKPKEIVDNIVKFFRDLPGKIKEVWNDVIDLLNKLPGKMITLGKNLLSGILKGIGDAKDWFLTKVSDFFGGLLDGFFDGIKSAKVSTTNITPIPKLASGTVVPANYGEFLAVLGDNKRETEVVSPVSAIKQALKEAMSENGGNGGNISLNITLKVGENAFGAACINSINRITRQTGELAIDLV